MVGRSKINVKQVHYKDAAGIECYVYAVVISREELAAELLGANVVSDRWRYLVCGKAMYRWEIKSQLWKRSASQVIRVMSIHAGGDLT